MKKARIVQAAVMVLVVVVLASCTTTNRGYRNYPPPPPPRTSVSLIISPYPGIVVNRWSDGRYYYRAPNGYMYWRGPGGRYYLDRRYMQRSYHYHNQYNDWRRYYRRR